MQDAREQSELVAVEQMRKNQDARFAGISRRMQAHALPVEDGDVDGRQAQSPQQRAKRTRHLARIAARADETSHPHQASLCKIWPKRAERNVRPGIPSRATQDGVPWHALTLESETNTGDRGGPTGPSPRQDRRLAKRPEPRKIEACAEGGRGMVDKGAQQDNDWVLMAMVAVAASDGGLDARETASSSRSIRINRAERSSVDEVARAADALAKGDTIAAFAAASKTLDRGAKEEVIRAPIACCLPTTASPGEERKKLKDIAAALQDPRDPFRRDPRRSRHRACAQRAALARTALPRLAPPSRRWTKVPPNFEAVSTSR